MIKLIISDMDGTLLNDEQKFAPDFFDVLTELNKRNIKFVIASGRSQYTLAKIFGPYTSEICYISDNGGYIKNKDIEKIILPLTRDEVLNTVNNCLSIDGLQVIMCAKDKTYFVKPNPEYIPVISQYYINYEIIDEYEKIDEQILKIAVFDSLGASINGYPKIKNKIDNNLSAVVSSENWLDIMNKGLNKGVAVKYLQEYFSVSEEETMVFGDFNNDIEMMKCAKYSFAMDNATDDLKRAANYIADSNNNFGVVKSIKEFILKD